MAKKPTPPPGADTAPIQAHPLDSADGRAWLRAQIFAAKTDLRLGPGGTWIGNESKRPALEERIAFLEALLNVA